MLTRGAEQLPWRLSDRAIKSLWISPRGDRPAVRVEHELTPGVAKVEPSSLQFGQRYGVAIELVDGYTAKSNFRVVLREDQQALDDEVQRIRWSLDIWLLSQALMISSLLDVEGFVLNAT